MHERGGENNTTTSHAYRRGKDAGGSRRMPGSERGTIERERGSNESA